MTPPASDAAAEIAGLNAEIEQLKGWTPDQSHVMKDVGYHFANLSFAGQQQNWPLATFYLTEMRSHLKWAVRIIPVRQTQPGEADLRPPSAFRHAAQIGQLRTEGLAKRAIARQLGIGGTSVRRILQATRGG